MNQIFETDRLIFRNWQLEDAEILYKYASDRQVCELALWPRHESVDMSRQIIKDFFLPNRHNFAIVMKETGEPIGCIGLVPKGDEHYETAKEEREVGYWVG
ncbi:MAG: GNAT family N-acetyltransferase, partial [Bacteroides sp.]|nr:GNAT family N-acetyltransferase [Bacteroides sp.]